MKQLLKIVFVLVSINVCGQANNSLLKYDFSSLWTTTNNLWVYGFIGENYQRMRVKIITATKDTICSDTYLIFGKTKVKDNIREFKGTIKIKDVSANKEMHWGVDDEYKDKGIKKEGILTGEYHFTEDSSQSSTGIFIGHLTSYWYVDKSNQLKYDDIERNSDNYRNNQFIGTWTSYKNHQKKICNWGDYRIPQSDSLDIGTGEFSPSDKYLEYGWKTIHDAYVDKQGKTGSIARQEEERQWWKIIQSNCVKTINFNKTTTILYQRTPVFD